MIHYNYILVNDRVVDDAQILVLIAQKGYYICTYSCCWGVYAFYTDRYGKIHKLD